MEETPIDQPPTKPVKSKQPYRGKQSSKQHSEAFRERKGKELMAQNSARLDSNLFSHLSDINNRLISFKHEPQKVVPTISQTTRAIRFASQRCVSWVNAIKPNLNVHAVYRCSLAQHYYIMHKSGDSVTKYRPGAPFQDFQAEPSLGFLQVVENEANSKNFSPIVAVLSNFGKVHFNSTVYAGFTPVNSVHYQHLVSEEPEPSRKKRPAPSADVFVGADYVMNPFAVTFQTLRQTVMQWADPNTSVVIRESFAMNNRYEVVI